ncbi:Chitin synthase regulatory factor Chr2 [Schizosaccharomyces pombe]
MLVSNGGTGSAHEWDRTTIDYDIEPSSDTHAIEISSNDDYLHPLAQFKKSEEFDEVPTNTLIHEVPSFSDSASNIQSQRNLSPFKELEIVSKKKSEQTFSSAVDFSAINVKNLNLKSGLFDPEPPSYDPDYAFNQRSLQSDPGSDEMFRNFKKSISLEELKSSYKLASAEMCEPETRLSFLQLALQAEKSSSRRNREYVARKKEEAFDYLTSFVSQGNSFFGYSEALYLLAVCYGTGALGTEINEKEAYRLYKMAADLNHVQAAYRVAICLQMGFGVTQNTEEAIHYFFRAASGQHVGAMHRMALIYFRGLMSVKRDPVKAMYYLNLGALEADHEFPQALYDLAELYEHGSSYLDGLLELSPRKAFVLYHIAAKYGLKDAQLRVARCFELGQLECDINLVRSFVWYRRLARKRNPEAMWKLSQFYLNGVDDVIYPNPELANEWAKAAAYKNHHLASTFVQDVGKEDVFEKTSITISNEERKSRNSESLPKKKKRLSMLSFKRSKNRESCIIS